MTSWVIYDMSSRGGMGIESSAYTTSMRGRCQGDAVAADGRSLHGK